MSVVTHLQPCRDRPADLDRRAALDALSDAVDWLYGGVRLWRRRRRDRAELARLDDRALLDIGISRADAEFLINKPFWRE
jgi:uncharacterized protein YjiS (DUF1127 family)